MKKIFTLTVAVLASIGVWAAYEPTADEVIILDNVYSAEATDAGFSTHAAIAWGATASANSKKCGDPANDGESTSGNVKCYSVKGNGGGKNITINVEGCSKVIVYHEKHSSRYLELLDGSLEGSQIAKGEANTFFTEATLDPNEEYLLFMHGTAGTDNQDLSVYAVKLIKGTKKEVKSTLVDLTAVKVNDEALEASQLQALLNDKTLDLGAEFVDAPTVTFVATTTITYTDDSQKKKDAELNVVAVANGDKWEAEQIVGLNTYKITFVKPLAYVVSYYDGTTLLGSENVKAGAYAAEYAKYQVKSLASFLGWFSDAELTTSADPATLAINAATAFYGKWEKAYAQSVNIEQLVLDEGTKYDIKAALTAKGIAYANIDALDTLNDLDKKDNRNYAFLGLKMKKSGAKLACNIKAGDTITVQFGNLPDGIKVRVNGGQEQTIKDVDKIGRRAEADEYLELITPSDKTVVVKQIMINEGVAAVELPAPSAYAINVTAENGKVTAKVGGAEYDLTKKNVLIGASVELTVTANDGYEIQAVTLDGSAVELTDGKYSFTMPAAEVAFVATIESKPTALDNTEAGAKAQKVIENGRLLIIKNGVTYNAQGMVVK